MIAQMIYDALVKKRPAGIRSRLIIKLVATAREVVLKAEDPLVDYTVGGASIKIPLSHDLGVYYRNDSSYAVCLASIARIVQSKYAGLRFIDVGANVGDTVALLRAQAHFPILAIEGDSAFFSTMEINSRAFKDVTTVQCFLGDSDHADAGLSFVFDHGTGRLEKSGEKSGTTGAGFKLIRLDELLRQYPAFEDSKMIKIDTDGFDAKVLRGAAQWLQRQKPVVFFEYVPHLWEENDEDCISVFSMLKDCGYRRFIVFRASGEYFCSADTGNLEFIEELRLIHKEIQLYCDICAFSEDDLDLFAQVRNHEMAVQLARSRW